MTRLFLSSLSIQNFRNFTSLSFEPHTRFNIISGRNGVGKTNLLEAIYMFGVLRSFRTSVREELIRHGQEGCFLKGIFGGAAAGLVCEVSVARGGRRIRVDGKPLQQTGAHFGHLPMVLFTPSSMDLVQSGPEARRRFLNRALFQAEPSYPVLHRDYLKALASRNALLKQGTVAPSTLRPYEEQIAELGSQIVALRDRFLGELRPLFEEAFSEISVGLTAEVHYRPKVEADPKRFLLALDERRRVDIARGFTTIGPHSDEIELTLNAMAGRKFASQGQQRLIALALKIAETRALARATARIPILLLDDISSELDRERNLHLFRFLAGVGGQVFITTTHLDHILIEGDRSDLELV